VLEEVAKFRAARRLWARMMVEKYGAKNPASGQLRFHTFTAGSLLTAQQPLNNVIRVTIETMAAALGGIQTLASSSYDEALGLPSEEAVTIALRTQQIVAEESGVSNTADPLGGSYYVEALTNRMEREAQAWIDKVNGQGGSVTCIENGFLQRVLAQEAFEQQRRIEAGEQILVGVNRYKTEETANVKAFRVDPKVAELQAVKLARLRLDRDNTAVEASLKRLKDDAEHSERNICPATIDAVRAYATVGEMCDTLRYVFVEYRDTGML
ncbi:MAG: methylmalonyl-CoA mutase, partial [Chloroflexota bacterium]|nr:methylmalonyl-CoA mutase [Chloroflexota bacterium]